MPCYNMSVQVLFFLKLLLAGSLPIILYEHTLHRINIRESQVKSISTLYIYGDQTLIHNYSFYKSPNNILNILNPVQSTCDYKTYWHLFKNWFLIIRGNKINNTRMKHIFHYHIFIIWVRYIKLIESNVLLESCHEARLEHLDSINFM